MKRILLLLALLPGLAFGQAAVEDFEELVTSGQGVSLAEQWPKISKAVQGLTPYFRGREIEGSDATAILTGLILGRSTGATYKNWRINVPASNDLELQVNIGSDAAPNWQTRATFDQSTGLTSPPAAHVHAASDVTSETFADIRISQSSVEQWAVQTPTANRIVQGNVSALIEPGWIGETSVTQHQGAIEIDASQVTSGQFADGRISASSVTQHGYLLQSGDVFLRFSGSCPSGTTEYASARGVPVRGADTLADDGNVPDGPGVRCDASSAPAGCGAPDVSNYSDFISTSEMPAHTHTGPSHSHTTTISNHQHTQPTHNHTISHTHQVTPAAHDHDFSVRIGQGADANTAAGTEGFQGKATWNFPEVETYTTQSVSSGAVTSGAASVTNSGSGGGDATGSAGGGTFGSNTSGTAATGSAGGTQPMIGPFVTARFCVVD